MLKVTYKFTVVFVAEVYLEQINGGFFCENN